MFVCSTYLYDKLENRERGQTASIRKDYTSPWIHLIFSLFPIPIIHLRNPP